MKRLLKFLLLATVIVVSGCGGPSLITDDGISRSEILFSHNRERMKNDESLPQLQYSSELESRAQKWAEWMARNNNMVHSKLGGSSFGYMGENIAMGYPDVDGVMKGWMDSTGHRHNILNKNYTHAGFGYARMKNGAPFWCAQFGGN